MEKGLNEAIAGVRSCVEWGFGGVVQNFAFLDFSKNLKIGLQPVRTLYTVVTILSNCRVCLDHGGKTSDFCQIAPPTFEQYLVDQKNI